jgi:integrase
VAQIDLGNVGGKRLRPTVTAKTRAELSRKMAQKRREIDAGVLSDDATVEAWLTYWLDNVAANRVRERTLQGYRGYVRTWLIPHLGRHRLDKLKPDHVRALYAAMEKAGLSDATRRQAHAILRRALVVAERDGRIMRNPAAMVDPPPVGTVHHVPLTLTEARSVLAVLDGDPLAARWACALLQGMRQGECLGLRWANVDIDARRITIREELVRITGKGLQLTPPKSTTSTRSIPMLEPVALLLDAMPRTGEFVFYGKAMDPRRDWGLWKALLVRAGVCAPDMAEGDMPALHAARGTTASLLHEAGVPDKTIAEILGHSSVQITRQAYIHGNEDTHRKAMKALEAFVAPAGD